MTLPVDDRPAHWRVLMTTDTVGGVWTYSLELARALAEREVEVTLAAMGGLASEAQRQAALAVPGLRLHESTLKLPWMDDPWDDVRAAGDWLLDIAADAEPDLVHLSEPVLAALPWRAPTVAVGHSCVLSWWSAVRGERAPAMWNRYREAMTRGLGAADAVAAPSSAMLTALAIHYAVRGGRVIPNGRSAARFPPREKEEFVLTAGRIWDGAKNVAALDAVAPSLPWPVYAAGDERHPDGGNGRIAATPGLNALGRLGEAELARWLGHAAIFALPARYEPFGLGPLEAGLAGCALVLGDIASLREVWGDAALFVPPDDHRALRETIAGLIADPARRHELGHRARARALRYSPERMAEGYLGLYGELLRRHADRREAACAS